MPAELLRQHLIDPEICIRCNTCEETCKRDAITHDRGTYAVRFDLCNACGDCLPPCPTGAIDSWRRVLTPYTVEEQLFWDSLPPDAVLPAQMPSTGGEQEPGGAEPELPADVARILADSLAGQGGKVPPPWSAAHPYVNLYPPARPVRATVTGVYRLTDESAETDIRHIVLDFGKTAFPVLEGQSIGVLPPGTDAQGRPHHVRLYSVASPRNGERPGYNNLAITVKRVSADPAGRPVRGVCSNYLCDLKKGDVVQVAGPYGSSFLMPNHPGSSLLMICTGTGAAPMRAMTERRRRRLGLGEGGTLTLFFGARTAGELPYFGPLMRLPSSFIDVNLAFSREPGQARCYVQDLLRRRADLVAARLKDEDCFLYICGHKRMEDGVHEALAEVCAQHGMDWAKLQPALLTAGRLHIETY